MRIVRPLEFFPPEEREEVIPLMTDEGIFDTDTYLQTRESSVAEEIESLPETVVMRVKPVPLPIQDLSALISVTSDGIPLREQRIYSPETLAIRFDLNSNLCQFAGIQLQYVTTLTESAKPSVALHEGDVIYEKPFAFAKPGTLVNTFTTNESTRAILKNPPGRENVRYLYGYGGRFEGGLPLEAYEQIYFEAVDGGDASEIVLTSESIWRSREVSLDGEGIYQNHKVMKDPTIKAEQSLNLGAALAGGYASLRITDPEGESQLYHSVSACCPHESPEFIDITFQLTKGKGELNE